MAREKKPVHGFFPLLVDFNVKKFMKQYFGL